LTVSRYLQRLYPHFASAPVLLALHGAPMELLWLSAVERDEAFVFVRDRLAQIARGVLRESAPRAARQSAKAKSRSAAKRRVKSGS
jgi:hypothetical protein